jgi:ubiquinone/menaquinone biosynthesis C-methylase UbiE
VIAETQTDILPQLHQAAAFDAIAQDYDRIFTHTRLGNAHRSLIHDLLRKHLHAGHRILDLNCGTGEDALYLASLGVSVTGCDISKGMIGVARRKAERANCALRVQFMVCANERLNRLIDDEPFDAALSNFGGLNCTVDLHGLGKELSRLVRPGGRLFVCMIGNVCAWETVWYAARGNWKKAFRRFKRGAVNGSVGDANCRVHYPSVADMRESFAPFFRLDRWDGIGIVLPPSWLASAFERWPWFVQLLKDIDRLLCSAPVCRALADHRLFQFVREER